MLNTMFTQGSKVLSMHNNKEGIMPMHAHLSIEDVYRDVTTKKEENNMVHTSADRSLMFRIGDNWAATLRYIEAYNKRLAEEQEMVNQQEAINAATTNLEETDRMIRTFFGRKFQMDSKFEGPSLSTNKKLRRELNMAWRANMKVFMENMIKAEDPRLKEGRRAFTQKRQAEAQAKVMQEAAERKIARQQKHQLKVAKMEAKKLEGKTPKQVKRTKRVLDTTKVIPVLVHTMSVFAINMEGEAEQVKSIYTIGTGVDTPTINMEVFKVIKMPVIQAKKASIEATRKRNILIQGKGFRALVEANIKDQKIITQGRRMRMLVSALMTNKEV